MERRYRTEVFLSLGLVLLTLGAFGPVVGNGFVNYDDGLYVRTNPHVRGGLTPANASWALRTTTLGHWHPLTWLSLQLDASLYGPDAAWGFHLSSLLLHAAAVVVLFWALRRMTAAPWRSAAVAALFAVHPLRVESVAWAAERKDVLSGLFWMLTLLAYAWYVERPGWRRYLLVLAVFALGLTAKSMLVTLPCVLLLLDYWPLQRVASGPHKPEAPAKETPSLALQACVGPSLALQACVGRKRLFGLLLEKLPLFALSAASCALAYFAMKKFGAIAASDALPLSLRLGNSVVAYTGYLGKMVWPSGLAPLYPFPRSGLPFSQVRSAGLLLATLTGVVLWARRRRYLTVGWLWYLGTLVPVIGVIQQGSQALADHYSYIPSVGVFLALVWGAADLSARWPARVGAAVALAALLVGVWLPLAFWRAVGAGAEVMEDRLFFVPLAALSVGAVVGGWAGRRAGLWPARLPPLAPALTLLLGVCVALTAWQVRVWRDSFWLWEYTLRVTEDNWVAHGSLGLALFQQGRDDEAVGEFQEALRIDPQDVPSLGGLAAVRARQGRTEEAVELFAAACRLAPGRPDLLDYWGAALVRQGRFADAVARLEEARRIDPSRPAVQAHLGVALGGLGRWDEACDALGRAAELAPQVGEFRADLARALWHAGRTDAAREEYDDLRHRDDSWLERTHTLARTRAADPSPSRRNANEALRLAEQVCQATDHRDARLVDTLAAAHAEAGDFDRAVATARQARALAVGEPDLARQIEAHVRLFEDHKPFRDAP